MSQSILSYLKRATGAINKDRDESVLSLSVTTTGLTEKELECVYDGVSEAEGRPKKKRMTYKEEDILKIASFAHQPHREHYPRMVDEIPLSNQECYIREDHHNRCKTWPTCNFLTNLMQIFESFL